MMIQDKKKFSIDLVARMHHYLKQRTYKNSVLDPKILENILCETLGIKNVGDLELYADGIGENFQVSIKTIKIKTTDHNDNFQDFPEKHLGPYFSDNTWRAGPEIVWRRQRVENELDNPAKIGEFCLTELYKKCQESMQKFGVDDSYNLYLIHGLDKDEQLYRVSVYWEKTKKMHNGLFWTRPKILKANVEQLDNKVRGYRNNNDQQFLEWIRIDGNVNRYATCLIELKNFLNFTEEQQLHFQVVMPDMHLFDLQQCVDEQKIIQLRYAQADITRQHVFNDLFSDTKPILNNYMKNLMAFYSE